MPRTLFNIQLTKGGDIMGNLQIHESIKEELGKVEFILKNIGKNIATLTTQDVFEHFFKIPGKYLRPTLILLSANAVNPSMSAEQKEQLVSLSTAIELIHSASLIHDDIIDGDLLRRGQKTLNNVYGRKIAVLAGDTLYAQAFSILSSLPREAEKNITNVIKKMCVAEIDQAKESEMSQQLYFKVIEGKTASFMSACCRLGALLAAATQEQIIAMENYGLCFGMVYQIIDDCIDDDPNAIHNVTIDDAHMFAEKALKSLDIVESSEYKKGLNDLLNYILSLSCTTTKSL